MPTKDSKVAILFFSRSAEAEGMRKQFVNDTNRKKNVGVARSLIGHTRKQLRQTNIPVYEINETHQKGTSFGERFANAFAEVFEKGYRYVIAVGNDTPELTAKHLNEAQQLLTGGQAQIVLGPAQDGGTWLMGYHRQAFDHRSFQRLPWKSPRLLHVILKQSRKEIAISQLESFADIDNFKILIHFVHQCNFSCSSLLLLAGLILNILFVGVEASAFPAFLNPTSPAYSFPSLRAPPLVV